MHRRRVPGSYRVSLFFDIQTKQDKIKKSVEKALFDERYERKNRSHACQFFKELKCLCWIHTQCIVGLHDVRGIDGRKIRPVNAIVVSDSAASSHAVHAAIQNLKVDVFSLAIAVHPQHDEIDPLSLVLQMRNDGTLARLAFDRCVEEFSGIHYFCRNKSKTRQTVCIRKRDCFTCVFAIRSEYNGF